MITKLTDFYRVNDEVCTFKLPNIKVSSEELVPSAAVEKNVFNKVQLKCLYKQAVEDMIKKNSPVIEKQLAKELQTKMDARKNIKMNFMSPLKNGYIYCKIFPSLVFELEKEDDLSELNFSYKVSVWSRLDEDGSSCDWGLTFTVANYFR